MTSKRSIAAQLQDLRDRVVDGPGELPSEVRRAAAAGSDVPVAARAYTEKVRHHAYKVVDHDVEELKSAGWSEDQIFELTVATAVGAGLSRLDHALRVMKEAGN